MIIHILNSFKKLSIPKKIFLSFLGIILLGSVILSLPMSNLPTSKATYLDHLFTSASMVCVTGLFTQPVISTYSTFGQIVHIFLIQVGGLGLMTIIAGICIYFKVHISFQNVLAVKEGLNRGDMSHFQQFLKLIIHYVLLFELIGAILLSTQFIPIYGIKKGIFNAIYCSISAFCNAGFDNLGLSSVQDFRTNPIVMLTLSLLIILGGIGFSVWFDIQSNLKERKGKLKRNPYKIFFKGLLPHTKLVLMINSILLLGGMVTILVLEFNNASTLGNLHLGQKLLVSFFESTTMRTAGFGSLDYTLISPATMTFCIGLMFIGGSSGGTAGGLKTTTFAVIVLSLIAFLKNKKDVTFKYHHITDRIIRQSFINLMMFFSIIFLGFFSLILLNPKINPLYIFYETVSAIATVGVSANLTPTLGSASHICIMILMFIGRIGPITLAIALQLRHQKKTIQIQYPSTNIIIG